MEIQNDEKFIKGVESLINPMEVSNLLFFQRLKGLLPPASYEENATHSIKKYSINRICD